MSELDWYYLIGDEKHGPVKEGELQELANSGIISGETFLWHEKLDQWQPAAQVLNLNFVGSSVASSSRRLVTGDQATMAHIVNSLSSEEPAPHFSVMQWVMLVPMVISFIVVAPILYLAMTSGPDNEAIEDYQTMFREKTTAEAYYTGRRKESYPTGRRSKYRDPNRVILYKHEYSFSVDGERYSGYEPGLRESAGKGLTIYYLKSDPRINCIDPLVSIVRVEGGDAVGSNRKAFTTWGLLGVFCLVGFVSATIKKRKKEKKAERGQSGFKA